MVRATHGVFRGSYYFEVEILPHTAPKCATSFTADGDSGSSSSECPQEAMPNPHIRIGWSTRQGELQAPVGFDQYSYGYRDSCGKLVYLYSYRISAHCLFNYRINKLIHSYIHLTILIYKCSQHLKQ